VEYLLRLVSLRNALSENGISGTILSRRAAVVRGDGGFLFGGFSVVMV